MSKFMVDHDRPGCIGCGACAAVCPQHWEMSAVDGKSDLKGSNHTREGELTTREQLDIEDLAGNKEAADSCPVNVIHIINKETGEKLI